MNRFPEDVCNDKSYLESNLAIQLYGHRIHESQTVGEYLLEFLLVFIGVNGGKGGFVVDSSLKKLEYRIDPNIGLKRFVFLENSKTINRYTADEDANKQLNEVIKGSIQSDHLAADRVLYIIKDLLYGFSLITQQRGWFAQSMIPLCKGVIFCEAMGNKAERNDKKMKFRVGSDDRINPKIDTAFGFNQHNFLARGGEVYYLHLLQGLNELNSCSNDNATDQAVEEINCGLRRLINGFPELECLTEFIQKKWESYLEKNFAYDSVIESQETIREYHADKLKCGWIKERSKKYSLLSIQELKSLLSTDMNEFDKLELLNIGIVLQLFRLMTYEAYCTDKEDSDGRPVWLMHISSETIGNDKIKTLAIEHYSILENHMMNALNNQLKYRDVHLGEHTPRQSVLKELKDAYDDSHKLLRKIGKEIGMITPLTGPNMRLTISDNIIRYLVISLIEPASSITLDRFLDKLYKHYGIVIREKEYSNHMYQYENKKKYAPYLKYNYDAFLSQLKANGFLRELSDATAIVKNPYEKLEVC